MLPFVITPFVNQFGPGVQLEDLRMTSFKVGPGERRYIVDAGDFFAEAAAPGASRYLPHAQPR